MNENAFTFTVTTVIISINIQYLVQGNEENAAVKQIWVLSELDQVICTYPLNLLYLTCKMEKLTPAPTLGGCGVGEVKLVTGLLF